MATLTRKRYLTHSLSSFLIISHTTFFSLPPSLSPSLQAIQYSAIVSQLIPASSSSSSADPKGQFFYHRLTLSPGNYSVVMPALDPKDKNSVVTVVFQVTIM